MDDLSQLSAGSTSHINHGWPRYYTPIRVENLCPFLPAHPDQTFAGFRIGYSDPQPYLQSRVSNHPSSLANEAVVQERITSEVRALRAHMTPLVQVSPLGLVPKAHQASRWHTIVDLSHPPHGSVNDGICRNLCSLHYAS